MSKPIIIPLIILLIGCAPAVREIQFGQDQCHFCKMTVVDQRHAAEAVTDKGKAYVFDAIECMVNYVNQENNDTYALQVVNDFANPGELIEVESSVFLISKGIPSPMGEDLSAFSEKSVAQKYQESEGGELYTWDGLKEKFLQDQ